ncbi:MAG: hypothetical protein WCN92_05160 [Eubacteriales bacterium]
MWVELVEAAPFNNPLKTKVKEFSGVGGHLFAEAVRQSFEAGNDGAIAFRAKTSLISHYEQELGAKVSNPKERIMLIDGEAAKRLFERYFGKG